MERSIDPNFDDAREHLGMYFADIDQHENAVESFQRAIAIEDNALRSTLLSKSLVIPYRWPEAEVACRRAVELEPNHPDLLANLATVVSMPGKTAELIELC